MSEGATEINSEGPGRGTGIDSEGPGERDWD